MQQNKSQKGINSVDYIYILKSLLRHLWILILCAIIGFGAGFAYANYRITPMYSSSVLLYVYNGSISIGNLSVSATDISSSNKFIQTYKVLLKNRTTLEMIREKSGLEYDYQSLDSMISASAVDETEVMRVTVTCDDPYKAADLANVVAEVLPQRISEIMGNNSMVVVDSAIPNTGKISPNISKYALMGAFAGIAFAAAVVVLFAVGDDTIHDLDSLTQNYKIPILARIPDLVTDSGSHGKYYYYKNYYKSSGSADENDNSTKEGKN